MKLTNITQNTMKNLFRKSFLYDLCRPYIQKLQYRKWIRTGKSGPAPSLETHRIVQEYAEKVNAKILIETGTFLGDMVNAQKNNFDKIYSIELDEKLVVKSQKRFKNYSHIEIHQGNSVDILPKILEEVQEPCLFWLDAHYSGGITAKGKIESPVMDELEIIFKKLGEEIVLLIDDARSFIGKNGYPTIEDLESFVKEKQPQWLFEVKDDVIRTLKR